MGPLFRLLTRLPFTRSLVRLLVGALAIPVFRLFLKRVVRLQELDRELEKDLEQWFRGSLLLLVATANLEDSLFGWVPVDLQGENGWILAGMRIMLAIGITEAMPDQELFAVLHPGPPRLVFPRGEIWQACRQQFWPCIKGLACQHLNRSSQMFAILAAIVTGWQGWLCYGLAVVQYLVIGLVTSRDKAFDVLSEFDQQVKMRRRWLIDELHLDEKRETAPALPDAAQATRPAVAE